MMKTKVKQITRAIAGFLEFECKKIKLIKLVIATVLSVVLLDFATWQDALLQGLMIALCVVDFERE